MVATHQKERIPSKRHALGDVYSQQGSKGKRTNKEVGVMHPMLHIYAIGIAVTIGLTISFPIKALLGHPPSDLTIVVLLANWYVMLTKNEMWAEIWGKWKNRGE